MPSPGGINIIKHRNGNTIDIMNVMFYCHNQNKNETSKLAKYVKADTTKETCKNIWHLLKEEITYLKDPLNKQFVKSPAQTWKDGYGDCKAFSIFTASLLHNLGIDGYYKFTNYSLLKRDPDHVYIIAEEGEEVIIIDCVADYFNFEYYPSNDWEFKINDHMKQINGLSGFNGISGIFRNIKRPVVWGYKYG